MTAFTKKAILKSFLELLNQKPLDKITVKEIADNCGISRNTFYYHFEDIRALLTALFDAEVERTLANHAHIDSIEKGFIKASRFVLDNRRAVYHIYNSPGRDEMERYLNSIAADVMQRLLEQMPCCAEISPADRTLIISFYKGGLVGIATDWIKDGMREDPEEKILRLGTLLDGSIAQAVQKSLHKE